MERGRLYLQRRLGALLVILMYGNLLAYIRQPCGKRVEPAEPAWKSQFITGVSNEIRMALLMCGDGTTAIHNPDCFLEAGIGQHTPMSESFVHA
jgi:Ni,Fe-hydrogenase I cytochrome b subunit